MDRHIEFALRLNADGPARELSDEATIIAALEAGEAVWLHLATRHRDTAAWIDLHLASLDESVREALVEPFTRPRASPAGDGTLLILRGINFNPDQDPEDMVSLRMWVGPNAIVSLSGEVLPAVDELAARVRAGTAPGRAAGVVADLIEVLTDHIEAHAVEFETGIDALESAIIADPRRDLSSQVSDKRLELTELRRFVPPQANAIRSLLRLARPRLEDGEAATLREQFDQMTRVIEQLEAQRERLATLRDELHAAQNEELNRNLYVVSVISAVFLPLGFLTGLMGINMGGIPGEHSAIAFWVFSGLLVAIALAVILILRRARIL